MILSVSRSVQRYHHGDLRSALLDAALALLHEGGPEAVTLRAAAARAGVSHAAPNHHFGDKAGLVEALAVRCFERFTAALQSAWDDTPGPSIARFRGVGLAYVGFATAHPEEFRLMNRSELRRTGRQGSERDDASRVERAARGAYDVLITAIRTSQADGFVADGDPHALALTAWSAVHGLAVLVIDGLLASGEEPLTSEELAGIVTGTLGLGLMPRREADDVAPQATAP
jgi:AcrR family transcriptional regulator